MTLDPTIRRTTTPRPKPHEGTLGFGQFFTDHMFVMDFEEGRGWYDPRIVPQGPLPIDPAACALQYGQSIFEGVKVFAQADGGLGLFRPDAHAARMAQSAARLCMPAVDTETFTQAIRALVREDAAWMPEGAGTALYVRPTIFATEAFLGVRPARHYLFVVLMSPVGSYWKKTTAPLRIWVERRYVRAAEGGIGAAKSGGNYAASLLAAEEAKKAGYDQVLWLDGAQRRYVEEIGTMNFFAQIGDELVTPPLGGSILAGVTRDSLLTLLRAEGARVAERPIEVSDLERAHAAGTLREMFGTGTAAVVAPIGELALSEKTAIKLPGPFPLAARLREAVDRIQHGVGPDPHAWRVRV